VKRLAKPEKPGERADDRNDTSENVDYCFCDHSRAKYQAFLRSGRPWGTNTGSTARRPRGLGQRRETGRGCEVIRDDSASRATLRAVFGRQAGRVSLADSDPGGLLGSGQW
jgi:hypothetical protein